MKRIRTIIGVADVPLHKWGAPELPPLANPHDARPGNALLLFFRVDNLDVALPRARALVSLLEEEPHVKPKLEQPNFRSAIRTDITSPSAARSVAWPPAPRQARPDGCCVPRA
jgi:hypothetical protein